MLAHYEIRASLGRGGMGEVYLARDTRLGRDVALKLLPVEMRADAGRRARISAACGADLGDPRVLARALTGAALAENPGGVVLVSSHAPARLRDHLATARDGAALRLGRDLRAALLHEGTRPEARE